MLRRCASFVTAAYAKYASFLGICAPCLRIFYKAVDYVQLFNFLGIPQN
jgi:hypothetical protein